MLATQSAPVNSQVGYVPGSLDAMVREWASRYWDDVAETWGTHRAYYRSQYIKQMRAETRAA
jgi:hypothetical protein